MNYKKIFTILSIMIAVFGLMVNIGLSKVPIQLNAALLVLFLQSNYWAMSSEEKR